MKTCSNPLFPFGNTSLCWVSAAELLSKATADLQTLQTAHQALHVSHEDATRILDAANAAVQQAAEDKQALAEQLSTATAEKVPGAPLL